MNGDINEMMSRVLSDPEALSRVMKIATGIMNNDGKNNDDDTIKTASEPNHDRPENNLSKSSDNIADLLHSGQMKLPTILSYDDNRVKLLSALRPYLGESRRQKIDYILNIMRIIKMLGGGKENI